MLEGRRTPDTIWSQRKPGQCSRDTRNSSQRFSLLPPTLNLSGPEAGLVSSPFSSLWLLHNPAISGTRSLGPLFLDPGLAGSCLLCPQLLSFSACPPLSSPPLALPPSLSPLMAWFSLESFSDASDSSPPYIYNKTFLSHS